MHAFLIYCLFKNLYNTFNAETQIPSYSIDSNFLTSFVLNYLFVSINFIHNLYFKSLAHYCTQVLQELQSRDFKCFEINRIILLSSLLSIFFNEKKRSTSFKIELVLKHTLTHYLTRLNCILLTFYWFNFEQRGSIRIIV